jgi:hypothetical protein
LQLAYMLLLCKLEKDALSKLISYEKQKTYHCGPMQHQEKSGRTNSIFGLRKRCLVFWEGTTSRQGSYVQLAHKTEVRLGSHSLLWLEPLCRVEVLMDRKLIHTKCICVGG